MFSRRMYLRRDFVCTGLGMAMAGAVVGVVAVCAKIPERPSTSSMSSSVEGLCEFWRR